MGKSCRSILQLIILLFIYNISYATQPVRNAYTNVVVSVCSPSDPNSNCGGSGGGGVGVGTVNPGTKNYLAVYQTNPTTLGPSTIPVVDTGTNIGIGTVVPNAKLDIFGDVQLSGSTSTISGQANNTGQGTNININSGTGITSSGNLIIRVPDGGSTTPGILQIHGGSGGGGAGGNVYVVSGNGGAAGHQPAGNTYIDAGLDLLGNGSIILGEINQGVNVGINTVSPGQILDVNGTARMLGFQLPGNNATSGYMLQANGPLGIGTWVPAPTGGSGSVANPTGTIGLTAVNGSASSAIRSDGAPALSQAIVPTWTGIHTFNGSPSIITSGNIGVGSATPGQVLDVIGNIRIPNNNSNTTKGTFQGINTPYEYWPPTGSGNVVDVVNSVANHPNQLAISSNNANSPGAMALWNSAITNGATLHVTGVTTAPAHNATYTNGTCTQTVYSSDLSGTAGALTGLIATRTNCTLAASGTLTKTGGVGDSSLTYGSITWEHDVSSMIGMPAGFYGAGDELHPELQDDAFTNPEFAIGYGVLARDTQGDSSLHINCGQRAPFSSGCGIFAGVQNNDGTVRDRVGNWFGNVQAGEPLNFDGGWNMNLFNPNSTNPKGYGIAMSNGPGLDGGGNFAGLFVDSIDLGTRFPWWTAHVHTPRENSWIFTVSGITTPPAFSGNTQPQYNISGSNNYDWVENNLTGGSGTITFESLATPPSSGTLTQNITDGIPIGAGDATITYTSVALENTYRDTMFLDQLHGNVGIDTFKPTQALDVLGTVRMTSARITSIASGTQCLQADSSGNVTGTGAGCGGSGSTPGGGQNAVQRNNASSFSGNEAVFSFNGANVGIGTTNGSLGILDIRGNVGIGTQFSIKQGGTNLINSVGSTQSYFIGDGAGNFGITGGDAICVGQASCPAITSGGDVFCGNKNSCKLLTTGGDVIGVGVNAASKTTTDSNLIWIGGGAGANYTDTTGNGNMVGIGPSAQGNATNGFQDNCVGTGCMGTTAGYIGQQNNCIGSACLANVTSTSQYLAAIGDSAGLSITSGHDDECLGSDSCTTNITSGHDDIVIGGHIDSPANISNFINIGNVLYGTGVTEGPSPSASANVGIGTATPRNALDIIGTGQMTGFKLTTNPTSGYVLTTNSVGIGTWAQGSSQWTTVNTNDVFLPNSGNVGLGTNITSGAALSVMNGNVGIGTWIPGMALNIKGGEGMTGGFNGMGNSYSNRGIPGGSIEMGYDLTNQIGNIASLQESIAWEPLNYNALSHNFFVSGNSKPSMDIVSSGNVGIGTTTPGGSLVVMGNVGLGVSNPSKSIVLSQQSGTDGFLFTGVSQSGSNTGTGFLFTQGFNSLGNKQFWLGDTDYIGLSSGFFNRYLVVGGYAAQDVISGDGLSYGTMNLGTSGGSKVAIDGAVSTALTLGSNLWVNGNAAVGSSYQSNTGPSNGLIVQGNVGIGTVNPGQFLDVKGNIRASLLGSSLAVASGTNGCQGQATLASGTITVSTACTPSSSQGIFLQDATTGSLVNIGVPTVGTVTGGTSFVINSSNALDSSNVNWWILKSS